MTAKKYEPGDEDGWAQFVEGAGGRRLLVDIEPAEKYKLGESKHVSRCMLARQALIDRVKTNDVDAVIRAHDGWCSVRPDDYIITYQDGSRTALSKEIFESTFMPLESLCPKNN